MRIFFILFLLIISAPLSFAFSDIDDNWYRNSILELKDAGVISGFEDGTFLPRNTTSRAELLKIIMNTAESEVYDTGASCFTDVESSVWYNKYICAGVDQGITNGYQDGTFKPNTTITVLEAIAFGTRAFGIDLREVEEGEEWFDRYSEFANDMNIVPDHSYTKDTLVMRGQAADIIARMKKVSDEEQLDYLSDGCMIDPALSSGSYTIGVGDMTRQYLLYVPDTAAAGNPLNLAIAFHGRTNSNEMVRDYMQLGGGRYGYRQNDFIVAYPAGLGAGPYSWSQTSNIEFFDDLLIELTDKLCIDKDKVFSIGHSLGSYMSNKISCRRGNVIRAMAGVASDGFRGNCSGPVASLITHLPGDRLAAYSGGQRAFSIRSEVNKCASQEVYTDLGDLKSCTFKTECSEGNPTFFCTSYSTYGNDQHSWPREGSDDILDFFRNIEDY